MDNELISIVVPVYNVEKYVGECIESIIQQSYERLEIIIINDGSTDGSLEICENYEVDSRVRVLDKKNEGLSVARQLGIDESKGSYFCMVDSDDILHREYIRKLYEKIKKYNADISLCARESFEGEKVISYYLEENLPEVLYLTKKDLEENYAKLTRQYQMSDSWNKMYRKEFVNSTSIKFSLDKKYNGTDLLFNYLLLLHLPKITIVNEILYYYRILPTSRVRRKDKKLYKGFFCIIEQLLEEMRKYDFSNKIYRELNIIYVYMMKYTSLDIFNEQEEEEKKRKKIQYFMTEDKMFRMKNNILVKNIKLPTVGMRWFNYCLNMKSSNGIICYYKVRKYLKKIFMKA